MEGRNPVSLFSLLSLRRTVFSDDRFGLYQLYPIMYKHIRAEKVSVIPSSDDDNYPYGSVFNIEFSPSDKLALTVCSNMSIAGYDPRLPVTKVACAVKHAHSDCVNCITFVDEFKFATCSDDSTIRLWDLRNIRSSTHTLNGHNNWIKNIEYNRNSNKLFSVAFFDGVRAWEMSALDQYIHNDCPDNLVVEVKDPVRMRISPDGSKMFISMRRNLCCIIDKFDGNSLADCNSVVQGLLQMKEGDLSGLKCNRPSIHVMSELQGENSFRAVMSVEFHPCHDMVALRYIDVKERSYHVHQELSALYDLRASEEDYRPYYSIQQTSQRYVKYIDEFSFDTVDFIKEFCFSPDGRVLASPHLRGVRLLAMDNNCTPVEIYYDERFNKSDKRCHDFEVVNTVSDISITSPVLSCRFAHHDSFLATGGFSGQFLFHKPRL